MRTLFGTRSFWSMDLCLPLPLNVPTARRRETMSYRILCALQVCRIRIYIGPAMQFQTLKLRKFINFIDYMANGIRMFSDIRNTYHIFNKSFSRLPQFFQVSEHMKTIFFFGQFHICIDCQIHARSAATITIMDAKMNSMLFSKNILYTIIPSQYVHRRNTYLQ